jgi:outer membrane protein TolC
MWKLTKRLKRNWAIVPLLMAGLMPVFVCAQENNPLSLDAAYELARKNYPLIRQKDLINKTSELSIANLQKGFLPQVTLSGQASYQSAVTEVYSPIPGFKVEPLSKDQYKLIADVSQLVYDGRITHEQKNIQVLNTEVEQQKVEVDLYKLKERINQVYLGVLFLDEQLKQVDLIKADLTTGIRKVEAQVNNGTAFRSNISLLQAELLEADQRAIEIKAARIGLLQVLGLFVNQPLTEKTQLQMPAPFEIVPATTVIARPELQLFSSRKNY